ncbi:phenylacetic acid degradation protein [Streptomyces abyssalis]|uniref:Phenylacetic acid degradation protein n=1 Tax=Streptomyces abyssalis TaxID=933944 RepID=A0A1E7JNP0_9ACTN|nr:PaaI family thioesterase [Streptomyces abyssalis]OEU86749.1 phenylacetic acid degradation protein [Streptomyces abyssalis]OEU89864.1 phenylacetic acid degradation protein [Streptomyces abyssalis]OEV08573.1 phenylacetic acid degradation protein [Streptomyces nanshensis]
MAQSTARPASGDSTTRSRTHTWEAPTTYLDAGDRPGLELVRLSLDGHLPSAPICGTLGFRLVEADEGRAAFEGDPGEHLFNPMGTVHGGFLATLLDSALGTAVMTTLPAGRAYTTVQLGVNMVRPVFGDTPALRCEGTVLHVGRTTATAEARVTGTADGRLYAHGTTTCLVFDAPRAG